MFLQAIVAHLFAEYLLQVIPVLRWKRAPQMTWKWALASLYHSVTWIGFVILFTQNQIDPWKYLLAGLIHGALDCTQIGDWLQEKLALSTVRSAVFVSVENELPVQVAALEFSLAASQESWARFAVHVGILWGLTL